MELYEKCRCGAEFKMCNEARTYIFKGGGSDNNGDRFVIQRELRTFRELHKDCLEPNEHTITVGGVKFKGPESDATS